MSFVVRAITWLLLAHISASTRNHHDDAYGSLTVRERMQHSRNSSIASFVSNTHGFALQLKPTTEGTIDIAIAIASHTNTSGTTTAISAFTDSANTPHDIFTPNHQMLSIETQQSSQSPPSRLPVSASSLVSTSSARYRSLALRHVANTIIIVHVLVVAVLASALFSRDAANRHTLSALVVLPLFSITISICCADYMELGTRSSCAVLTSPNNNSALKCWGHNLHGQLGYEDNNQRASPVNVSFVELGTNFRLKFLSSSAGGHRCAISHDNQAKCFGWNPYGQLGYGDKVPRGKVVNTMGDLLLPIDFGNNFVPTKIACGYAHTCALSMQHTIKCFGYNSNGQLGYNDVEVRGDAANEMGTNLTVVDLVSTFVPVDIAVGSFHSCVLSAAGTIKCFGKNDKLQLGDATLANTNSRGDSSGEVSSNWTSVVDLGVGFVATQLCTGSLHTCALSANGTVKCFGWNGDGELGIGSTVSYSLPNATVDLGQNFTVIAIACGTYHNCALSSTHSIKCWGKNSNGQLGYGDTLNRGGTSSTIGDFLPVVDLGNGFIPKEVKCGGYHTCVTSQDDRMKCFGHNYNGQLGYGDTQSRGDEAGEMGDNLPVIVVTLPTAAPTASPSVSPSNAPTAAPSASPSIARRITNIAPRSRTKSILENKTIVGSIAGVVGTIAISVASWFLWRHFNNGDRREQYRADAVEPAEEQQH